MTDPDRVRRISSSGPGRNPLWIVYWMQQTQRERCNHALELALEMGSESGLPVFVLFCLDPHYPEACRRHFSFMLEGLAETERDLRGRGITLVLQMGAPPARFAAACERAAVAVVDAGYTPIQRRWREEAARLCPCPLYEVDSDSVVPPRNLYPRSAWSAAVLRRRIAKLREGSLDCPGRGRVAFEGFDPCLESIPVGDAQCRMPGGEPAGPGPVAGVRGGAKAAGERLSAFLEKSLDSYVRDSGDPSRAGGSGLSPYLHFGQISVQEVASRAIEAGGPGAEPFLEQLTVRRELALNHSAYAARPGTWASLPEWARADLERHRMDPREHAYTKDEFESARTDDAAWNAAQRELVLTGGIHGYMRMYWGKMILAWSADPEEAYATALTLNNRYALDGRDPNSIAGVGWCFGLHDRPWPARPVFGMVRSMTGRSLGAKFDIGSYIGRIESLGAV